MKKTNFDRYLEEQMQDPAFAARFDHAGTFVRDRKGQVTHALLRINGAPIRARRVG